MVVYIDNGNFTIGATKTVMSPINPVYESKNAIRNNKYSRICKNFIDRFF